MKSLLKIIFQVLFFIILAKFCDFLVLWMHLPVPGSIVGIIILYILLKLKIIRLGWIEMGSQWLLSEMLLFFIPATVSIINYKALIMDSGLQVLATISGSTIVVMLCAGLIGQRISKRNEGDAA